LWQSTDISPAKSERDGTRQNAILFLKPAALHDRHVQNLPTKILNICRNYHFYLFFPPYERENVQAYEITALNFTSSWLIFTKLDCERNITGHTNDSQRPK
jgi:hypothetical protein